MKEKETKDAKVEEQPIITEEKENKTSFLTKAKKFGKWAGIALAGAGLFGIGYYSGKKSGTSTTTTVETETTEI